MLKHEFSHLNISLGPDMARRVFLSKTRIIVHKAVTFLRFLAKTSVARGGFDEYFSILDPLARS